MGPYHLILKPDSKPDPESIDSRLNRPSWNQEKVDLVNQLADWLKNDGVSIEARDNLLQDLSLDLPASLLRSYCSLAFDSSDPIYPKPIDSIEYCLNRLALDGNPREVFMSLVHTVRGLLRRSQFDGHQPLEEEALSSTDTILDETSIDPNLIRIVLSSLSIVLNRILPKSRNPPTGFFDQFSQSILGLLDACQMVIQPDLAFDIYLQIVSLCGVTRSLHAYLESKVSIFLAATTFLIFGRSHNQFPIAKVHLCRQEPRWLSSFSRLLKTETNSDCFQRTVFENQSDQEAQIHHYLLPIFDALDRIHINQNIFQTFDHLNQSSGDVQSSWVTTSLNELCYGRLTSEALVHSTRQGALLIYAWGRFIEAQQDLSESEYRAIKRLAETPEPSSSLSSLEAKLFLILVDYAKSRPSEELATKIIQLAANTPIESDRLLIFRSLAYLIERWSQSEQLGFANRLITSHDSDEVMITIALIHLTRERLSKPQHEFFVRNPTLVETTGSDSSSRDQTVRPLRELLIHVINSTRPDLSYIDRSSLTRQPHEQASIVDRLKLLVEKLNLVYLVLKRDQDNVVGIKRGSLNAKLKEDFVTPIFRWLANGAYHEDWILESQSLPTSSLLCSIKLSLDLCIETLHQS